MPAQRDELAHIRKTATNFAVSRCSSLSRSSRFKVNQTVLKEEIILGAMYGELSALERILIFIRDNKITDIADVEAALHLSIVTVNNHVGEKIGRRDTKIKLEDYLGMRGYYEKSPLAADLEGMRQQ